MRVLPTICVHMWTVSRVVSQSAYESSGHSELNCHLVDKTPAPVLARLNGSHDRMLHGVKVLGRVLVLGRVAAADMPACHAQAQVHPDIAHLQAFLAATRMRFDVPDLIGV